MAPNPRRVNARLDALYAELPTIHCQGLCFDSCGPIDMSVRERARIREQAGEVRCEALRCSMLVNNRCSVYSIRPMICRLWGLIEALPCHHGCRPEGGLLPDEEGMSLLARSMEIGGGCKRVDQELLRNLEELAAKLSAEEFSQRIKGAVEVTVPRPRL